MSQNLWSKMHRESWAEKAGDERLPDWLRVSMMGYARVAANGHATFARGDLALILATTDPETGIKTPRNRQAIDRAIVAAIRYGWLLDGSGTRCLIVPPHYVSYSVGNPRAECKVPHRPRKRAQTSSLNDDKPPPDEPVVITERLRRHHSAMTNDGNTAGQDVAPSPSPLYPLSRRAG